MFFFSHFWLAGARLRGVRWFRSGGAGGRLRLGFLRYPNLVPLDQRLRSFVARGPAGSSLVPPHPGLSCSMISPLDRSRRSSVQEWFYRLPVLSQVPLRVREEQHGQAGRGRGAIMTRRHLSPLEKDSKPGLHQASQALLKSPRGGRSVAWSASGTPNMHPRRREGVSDGSTSALLLKFNLEKGAASSWARLIGIPSCLASRKSA